MQTRILTVLLWVTAAACLIASRNKNGVQMLSSRDSKASYAFGFDIGKSLKRLSADLRFKVDMHAFIQGVRDAFFGCEPLLDPDKARKIKNELVAERNRRKRILAAENRKKSLRFLKRNRTQPGVLTTSSGLQYRVLEPGTGRRPGPGDAVRVHCRIQLLDGTIILDTHRRSKPLVYVVAKVIPGLAEGLQLIRQGAKVRLFVPPDLGYGPKGRPPHVPPNALLIYDIELLEVEPARSDCSSLNGPQCKKR